MVYQSLHHTFGQHLQLTPKLQQAIRMLQLSTHELTQELRQALEANVMLELEDSLNDIDTPVSQLSDDELGQAPEGFDQDTHNIEVTPYEASLESASTSSSDIDPNHYTDWQQQNQEDLHTHLLWQLRASQFSDQEYPIGEAIIDAINNDGLLTESLQEIQTHLHQQGQVVSYQQIAHVLEKIQGFDPTGVGACNLQQTLLLQLNTYPAQTPYLEVAKQIITDHLTLLADHHYDQLAKIYKLKNHELHHAISLIQSLNPRPANAYLWKEAPNYIIPDIVVVKKDHTWLVKLNPLLLPKLRLSPSYLGLLDQYPRGVNSHFIHTHLREAKWLMQCVKQRNETLLRVAACIIKHQQAFMTHGTGAMKALILKDIANELQLHQSTISRVSTKKYLQTPQGTFELKYFFSSHINTTYGRQCSALAIQTFLKDMIRHEDGDHPFSDDKLAQLLIDKGLKVARRTISKYRELLRIPAAAKRKRLNNL